MTQASIRDTGTEADVDLVGSFHRFGKDGVSYEVTKMAEGGNVWIRVLESGETLRYPADRVRRDPKA